MAAAIESGADVNFSPCPRVGNTMLHVAGILNFAMGARLLISHGANVRTVNGAGDAPADSARQMGNADLAEFLDSDFYEIPLAVEDPWASIDDGERAEIENHIFKIVAFVVGLE